MSKKKKLLEEHQKEILVPDSEYAIECENLVKIYKTDQIEVVALQGLDLQVKKGELVAIVGSSGSGCVQSVAALVMSLRKDRRFSGE